MLRSVVAVCPIIARPRRHVRRGFSSVILPGVSTSTPDLSVVLGRLSLPNPVLVASGTFGYAREMAPFADLSKLGGIIPKTVTPHMRPGNPPPRTIETSSGMLNSIGLDNDGIDYFCESHLPYLLGLGTSVIANIAAKTNDEFAAMAQKLEAFDLAGIELNISCPNVSGGVDFGTDPKLCQSVVETVRSNSRHPIIAKLTPNVTDVRPIAQAAADGGADAVSLVNTFQGMAVNWRKRRPILGNNVGGLSGPAIKPLALRIVWQVAQAVKFPIIGVGGIQTVDDVMEFLVAGASAVQIGTANFYKPAFAANVVNGIVDALSEAGAGSIREVIGTLHAN